MQHAGQLRVIFTDHAIERWQSRVYPRFDQTVAERAVLGARLATKSERRKSSYGFKSRRRQATHEDRHSCLINDDLKLIMFVIWKPEAVVVKTIWKIGGRRGEWDVVE